MSTNTTKTVYSDDLESRWTSLRRFNDGRPDRVLYRHRLCSSNKGRVRTYIEKTRSAPPCLSDTGKTVFFETELLPHSNQSNQPKSTPNRISAKFPTSLLYTADLGTYIYLYIYIVSHSPIVRRWASNCIIYLCLNEEKKTDRHWKTAGKNIYIYHVCILKTTFSAVLLTRRIYNLSSSLSFAVSSSTNLLLVLTRTRTHICVVTAVVSPPPWVYFGLCIRRSLPSIGRGLRESYIYLYFEEGVEFIPDVPKFPPSPLYLGLVCVCTIDIYIYLSIYTPQNVSRPHRSDRG